MEHEKALTDPVRAFEVIFFTRATRHSPCVQEVLATAVMTSETREVRYTSSEEMKIEQMF